jgi:hypothetical protein
LPWQFHSNNLSSRSGLPCKFNRSFHIMSYWHIRQHGMFCLFFSLSVISLIDWSQPNFAVFFLSGWFVLCFCWAFEAYWPLSSRIHVSCQLNSCFSSRKYLSCRLFLSCWLRYTNSVPCWYLRRCYWINFTSKLH